MAGNEMNYGSDLDLIFLYEDTSEDFRIFFSGKVRLLLRHMSLMSASGVLYDIDMRLRPHGTSGALITSVNSFLEYHQAPREIWERQMMTRCLPIVDYQGLGLRSMEQVHSHIYRRSYDSSLAKEILDVRLRVEDELGSRKGKIDVKRGRGGIMDIDFLTHYLQLMNAYKYPGLQTSSTRQALEALSAEGLLRQENSVFLLDTYDYFKKIEACLRLFDMKSVNAFPVKLDNHHALVRAMQYTGDSASQSFLEDFHKRRESVHTIFIDNLS
jgi:[glutamine synthetase] adenylyltransferase / [glutamine synthetase]-adenylyl-L-tyrosine phosphorylase